jgi:peptidoglycan-associated lipoprotein
MHCKILRFIVLACVAVVVVGAVAGCKGRRQAPISPGLADASATSGVGQTGRGDGMPQLTAQELENMLFGPAGLKTVYFDFDSSALRPDALRTLAENAELIKQAPGIFIQIEGHCDERGTQDYNFALGEKRALSVREHLIRLGVDGSRLITISYGEEDPVDPGHNEAAWARNRRCEFNKAM